MAALLTGNAANASHGRYTGSPDLTLTTQMVVAGGGPSNFSSYKLFSDMAGSHAAAEGRSLAARFGAYSVAQFFTTFDQFVHLAAVQLGSQHVQLPKVEPLSGVLLAQELYRAGIMPDHRYDVGYMLEHLLSRPMHVALMNAVNNDPAFGPAKNARFHVILTAAMQDLHHLYGS